MPVTLLQVIVAPRRVPTWWSSFELPLPVAGRSWLMALVCIATVLHHPGLCQS